MLNLCAPAIIYLIFSITQILIDTFKGLYNTAFVKVIIAIMVTLLLNILCDRGLSIVSWIIVFIPFILMTVVVSMVLYVFGLDAASGKFKKCDNSNTKCGNGIMIDALGNIIVYDPQYNPYTNPIYYKQPNIIIPNPNQKTNQQTNSYNYNSSNVTTYPPFPSGSSSPAYQSK
jgi:hypothetical protein